ncbi:SDR family NAD(P)-dependent oxidoreductase [Phyllobacterium chamaecytisi]|uniref:SDR family NAD(P)-dependent oxidoreductase n=1 Tax=Phyllobacterium chamaecytisi TaxID=2876082 RepID=UPI001CCC194C|nr:SDR family NAD(P)-dependent oxidoreductase [Phyllobacterium sp. KW56]MBZ9606014.1 SDR family oxidoreductase [Phyllobacterium sp. KW56]
MTAALALPSMPSLDLDGRRALVTGAGRGIGVALAAALVGAGAETWLAARTAGEVDDVAARLRAKGGSAHALPMDVTDLDGCERLLEALPPFDILVNNAGANRPKPMTGVTVDDYDAVFDLNVRATYFISRHVAGRMIAEGVRGSIIHIGSQMGHVGAANRTLYCASKHAVEGLNKAMAVELAPYGIRVNTIAPTFIDTPMTRPFFEDEAFRSAIMSKIKLGRLGKAEDLMGAVVFLASDAAAMMTGASLIIDGGWTAE